MNDTPRTEKQILKNVWTANEFLLIKNDYMEIISVKPRNCDEVVGVVPAEFARQLERELNEALKKIEDMGK